MPTFVVATPEQLQELVRDAVATALDELTPAREREPDLVDGAEMARRLSVSRTTLHRLRVAGMPAIPVGDTFRYKPAAVLTWLETRRAEVPENTQAR